MSFDTGDTIHVRGEGGSEFDVDVPEAGTVQRELLEDALDKGRLTIVEPEHTHKRGRGKAKADKPDPDAEALDELDAWATAMVNDGQYEDRDAALAALHGGND